MLPKVRGNLYVINSTTKGKTEAKIKENRKKLVVLNFIIFILNYVFKYFILTYLSVKIYINLNFLAIKNFKYISSNYSNSILKKFNVLRLL